MRENVIAWLARLQVGIQLVCRSQTFARHASELGCSTESEVEYVRGFCRMVRQVIDEELCDIEEGLTEVERASVMSLGDSARSLAESETVEWTGPGCEAEMFVYAADRLHRVFDVEMPAAIQRLETETTTSVDAHVKLDDLALLVRTSKKTLERKYADGKLCEPDVEGGGGKPHLWKYQRIRPHLEREFARILPEQWPGVEFAFQR